MENTNKELSMEEMEKGTGGLVVWDETKEKYWVVAQDGTVLGPAPDEKSAVSFANTFNTSPMIITMEEYKKHFGRDLVW